MQFIMTGFTQEMGFRVFGFERIGDDRVRTAFTVRADLALTRTYGIRIQELPLLCRCLLEQRQAADETRALTLTEGEMCLHAQVARDAAASRKKPSRKPPITENPGAAWRAPQPR